MRQPSATSPLRRISASRRKPRQPFEGTPPGHAGLEARIATLPVSESRKAVFQHFARGTLKAKFLGIPLFSPRLPGLLRYWDEGVAASFLYYLYLGIWRKAISIAALTLALALLAWVFLEGGSPSQIATGAPLSPETAKRLSLSLKFGMVLPPLLLIYQGYYDHYRHLVLREKFWW